MASTQRIRYLRHRLLRGRDRGHLRYLEAWLDRLSVKFTGTAATSTVTFSANNNSVVSTGHGYETGERVSIQLGGGAVIPNGLVENFGYIVIKQSTNAIRLALNLEDAFNDKYVTFSTAGSGTISLTRLTTDDEMVEYLRRGIKPATLEAVTDIDNL